MLINICIVGDIVNCKTYVIRKIISTLEEHDITLIEQDFYYKDQSHKTMEERLETNYDHPFAFDNDLLIQHVKSLINRESVELPTYDYVNHTRSDQTIKEIGRASCREYGAVESEHACVKDKST